MYFLQSVPDVAWFVWWQEQTVYDFEQQKQSDSRTTGMTSRPAGRVVNACPTAGMEEIDPYNLPPSFSIASVNSRMSQSSDIGRLSHRSFRIILLALFVVCWTLTIVGANRCTLMLVGPSDGSQGRFSGVGLFSRAVYYRGNVIGCVAYPETTKVAFDSPFQTGRVFGAVTAFLMTFICVLKLSQIFVDRARTEIWLVIRLLLPCATLSQLLTFIVFKTETCSMGDLIDCVPGKLG